MPRFNTRFDLSIRDMKLIETALQTCKKELSLQRLAMLSSHDGETSDAVAKLNAELVDLHDLMGRLHNQKVFYRPDAVQSDVPYVSG